MTGYGKASTEIKNKKFTVEIKSLNSKQLDLNVRLPGLYREKEVGLRNHLSPGLERGKSDIMIYYEAASEEKNHKINKELVLAYYQDLKDISGQLDEAHQGNELLPTLMRMPDVMRTERPELDEDEWASILELADQALIEFDRFRSSEGERLGIDILQRIENIGDLLTKIEPFEEQRVVRVRERIENNLKDLSSPEAHDSNRLEQELIYYLEKFDITEEKVRLRSHCTYFKETADQAKSQGKKLGFISQEIGREINTIGSKANDADIQRLVVQMKDELEKVKEQVLNVL